MLNRVGTPRIRSGKETNRKQALALTFVKVRYNLPIANDVSAGITQPFIERDHRDHFSVAQVSELETSLQQNPQARHKAFPIPD